MGGVSYGGSSGEYGVLLETAAFLGGQTALVSPIPPQAAKAESLPSRTKVNCKLAPECVLRNSLYLGPDRALQARQSLLLLPSSLMTSASA